MTAPHADDLRASRRHGTHLAAPASLERRPVCLRSADFRCTHPDDAKHRGTPHAGQ